PDVPGRPPLLPTKTNSCDPGTTVKTPLRRPPWPPTGLRQPPDAAPPAPPLPPRTSMRTLVTPAGTVYVVVVPAANGTGGAAWTGSGLASGRVPAKRTTPKMRAPIIKKRDIR